MELFVFVPEDPNVPKHLPSSGQPCFTVEREITRLNLLLKFSHSITGETVFVPIRYNYGTKHMSAWDPNMPEDVTSVKEVDEANRIVDRLQKSMTTTNVSSVSRILFHHTSRPTPPGADQNQSRLMYMLGILRQRPISDLKM